jgi:protease-4
VGVDGLGTTPLDGMLQRLDVPMSDAARTLVQATVDYGYGQFLQRVSDGRHQTPAQVDEIAQGRVWSGQDAKAHGLVDQLGSFDDALKAAARRAHMSDYKVQFMEPELTWAQSLALQVEVGGVRVLARTGLADLSGLGPLGGLTQLAKSTPLAREVARLNHLDQADRLYAYCFCTAQ